MKFSPAAHHFEREHASKRSQAASRSIPLHFAEAEVVGLLLIGADSWSLEAAGIGDPMTRILSCLSLSAALLVAAAAQLASAEVNPDQANAAVTSTAPVAYVYVSSTPKNSSNSEIVAYAAAPSGKLTPIPGSPFQDDVGSMAVNGKYLFGAAGHSANIDAYLIGSNGALRYSASTNYAQYNSDDCGSAGSVFLDHTGASLYVMEYEGDSCANNEYHSFAVQKATGKLTNLGSAAVNNWITLPASFIGNNVYAWSASCLGDMYWGIFGFKRSSNGLLTEIGGGRTPTPKQGDFFCPSQAAADPTNHVAITMQAVNGQEFSADGPPQLATYTVAADGSLTTTSTTANMPTTQVGSVMDINMAPSGKLLAVGGSAGLQVFHFNGASPITRYTGLLTTDAISQFFWDNNNHLYAISPSAGKLFVFTVTPTGYSQVPGSPYNIYNPGAIIVQPK